MIPLNQIKFLLLCIFQLPAISLSISILIYFASNSNARSKPKNFIWLILLILYFIQLITDLPMPMIYYYLGTIWPENVTYCIWWTWYELTLNSIGLYLTAWASVERHLLIFHSQITMRVRWKKWLFHFLPIIFCFLWVSIFHFIFIVISPTCTTIWRFTHVRCGTPCVLNAFGGIHGLIEFAVNITFPLTIMILANIILIIRVIYAKISHNQPINWRRQRKLTFQLGLMSLLYLLCWLPFATIQFMRLLISPYFLINQYDTVNFIVYFIPLLFPFVSLNIFPEFMTKIQQIIQRHMRINRIGIITVLQ